MLRERVRAVIGRVRKTEIAERTIARVKRKEAVLQEKLKGLRSRAGELRTWALNLKAKPEAKPVVATESAPTVSE